MFKKLSVNIFSDPVCKKSVDDLNLLDFRYYDKDGFELNRAEQKFYAKMDYPIWHDCLNHCGWQEPWFELDDETNKLILDHSIILHRAKYADAAHDQLIELRHSIPTAGFLLQTKQKWGFDFALDAAADDGTVYEVIHIEFDHADCDTFKNRVISVEHEILNRDWQYAADLIWQHRDKWQNLQGFEQNHWKSKFLLGWDRAESLEKAI